MATGMCISATVVYLLTQVGGTATAPTLKTLYVTADKPACEAQAKDWNAALGVAGGAKPVFVCLPHADDKMQPPSRLEQ